MERLLVEWETRKEVCEVVCELGQEINQWNLSSAAEIDINILA